MRRLTGLLLILFVMVLVGTVSAGAWQIETADSAGNVGEYTSLALDSSGNPHISYYHVAWHDLQYARWDGTAWQVETVDSAGDVGLHTSLALDSSGNPHISYFSQYIWSLKYARWDGSAWQVEDVDTDGSVGTYTSLALDSSGNPHISYGDLSHNNLKYAHWDGTAWQIETVDSAGYVGRYTSLALDSSGNPHISYCDWGNSALKYAHWDGSAWQIETVDTYRDRGKYTSLALDSSDNPHISYYDGTEYYLKYAHWDGSAWQIETVDSSGYVNGHTSLVLDSSGNPHISYRAGGTLKYAWWDPDASGVDDLSLFTNDKDDVGVEFVSLSAEAADEGILLSWSIVGDEPASVRVLRGLTQNDTLTQNGSVNLSGELSGSATSWLDVSAEAGVEYAYYLEVTELDGTVSRFGPSEVVVPGEVSELALSDPYPNPADESLTIHYELTQNATVKLHIYDVAGRLVETLVSGEQTAGRHSVSWDSSTAATGVYLLRLEANGEAITKRAVISR